MATTKSYRPYLTEKDLDNVIEALKESMQASGFSKTDLAVTLYKFESLRIKTNMGLTKPAYVGKEKASTDIFSSLGFTQPATTKIATADEERLNELVLKDPLTVEEQEELNAIQARLFNL